MEQNMKQALLSQTSLSTNKHSLHSLHNCPSCRCHSFLSSSSATKLGCPLKLQTNNIYVSPSSPQHRGRVLSPNESRVFPRIRFQTSQRKAASITFTYCSPRKNSSEAKLQTKSFKRKHFPGLQQREEKATKKIVKQSTKQNCYYEIYTEEETPKKPKLLNKTKKQKLEITLSPKHSQKSIQEDSFSLSNAPYNQYGLEQPRLTPIHALPLSGHHISYSQFIPHSRTVATPSIENIEFSRMQSTCSPPSSQNVLYFSQSRAVERPQGIGERWGLGGLGGISQESWEEGDEKLANSLSEQLNLHYDYFSLRGENERTLSHP